MLICLYILSHIGGPAVYGDSFPGDPEDNANTFTLRYVVEPLPARNNAYIVVEEWDWKGSLLGKPRFGPTYLLLFRNATITVEVDLVEEIVNFRVLLSGGLKVNVTGEERPAYSIVEENISFSYSSTYRVQPETMELFTLDGKWAGSFPYLARVDPERPRPKILSFNEQSVGFCGLPPELLDMIRGVAGFVEINLTVTRVEAQDRASFLAIRECVDFGLYLIYIDPRLPVRPYTSGELSFPAEELIRGTLVYGDAASRALGEAYEEHVVPLGPGIALGYAKGFVVVAVRFDSLPKDFATKLRRALEEGVASQVYQEGERLSVGGGEPGILFASGPYYAGIVGASAIYHVGGFLVAANFSIVRGGFVPVKVFLLPTFDLYAKYSGYLDVLMQVSGSQPRSGLTVYRFRLENASALSVRLVGVEGAVAPPVIQLSGKGYVPTAALAISTALACGSTVLLLYTRFRGR